MSQLSFVVPVYRPDLTLLSKCVDSLVVQSLKDWDAVFVVDGEDSAAVGAIRQAMKKSANHYKIINIEHGGAPKARNAGALHATGENIVFWDCDCLIEPDAAKNWIRVFDEEPEVGFIYSGYRFLRENGAIDSEPFDPWTLRVRNYISTCFPLRRKFLVKWNEDLKSLQDWDFWLSVVEKGAKGKFIRGYAFATAYPTEKSISGKGCGPGEWLDRVDTVKKLHNLPERDVCVTSLSKKTEATWLAKVINADYQDAVNSKPHRYTHIVHMGLSFLPGAFDYHVQDLNGPGKHTIFYTCDDIVEITTRLNLRAVWKYADLVNTHAHKQFVEDKNAKDTLEKAGFRVEVMPIPMQIGEVLPLPGKPRFALEVAEGHNGIFNFIQASLPDIELVRFGNAADIAEFTGLVHFHQDRTISSAMKRAVVSGRHVISNVQAPFMGFVDDMADLSKFIPAAVEKIRGAAYSAPKESGVSFYKSQLSPEKLINVLA